MTTTTLKKSIDAAEHPILLETSAQLSEAEKSWNGNRILGIDTEFVRERTYRADLGLVQVSNGTTAWLADPVRLDSMEPLARLLTESSVTKVIHSGSEDLEVLLHTIGAITTPLFDTQIACALLGQPLQMGYHTAVNWLFGIEVCKAQTRSNWCKRPLSDRQLHYAAMDVVLLPEMYETLRQRLEDKDRLAWLEEEVARAQQNARQSVDPETAYLRVSGVSRLDEDGLRVLQALAAWREKTAIQRNYARGFVISDTGLVNLAKARPESAAQARRIEGIHPRALERNQSQLLQIIRTALKDRAPVFRPEPLDSARRKLLGNMRTLVQERASGLGIEPALLASRRELERLVRDLDNGNGLPERFTGWRKAVIGDDLLTVIG